MKLLFIEARPRGEHCTPGQVANAFVEAYQKANPDHRVERLPLFDIELPSFSAEGSNQKMAQIIDMIFGGTKTNFARPYPEHVSRFIGFENICSIKIEPTGMLAPDQLEELIKARYEEAESAGASF